MKRKRDDELDREIRGHLELEAEERMSNGTPAEQARDAARRAFGNVAVVREDARAVWIRPWAEHARQDLRYAWRVLVGSPGFTVVAVLTLALGIGSNAAIFSLLNSILFRPLPVESPRELVRLLHTENGGWSEMDLNDVAHYREHSTAFAGLAAYSHVYMADGGDAREVDGYVVSGNFFFVLGVEPAVGRFFLPSEDEAPGRDPVVVLGHDFWRRRFNGDPAIVGRAIKLNGTLFTIVGVVPEALRAPNYGETPGEVWIPSMMLGVAERAQHTPFTLIGRLKSGETLDRARAEMTVLRGQLTPATVQANSRREISVARLAGVTGFTGATGEDANEFARIPRLLMAGVSCLLLIACANLAGLLLVRGLVRGKEIAVRLALGASGPRVIRQLMTESILLSLLGAVAGAFVAHGFITFLRRYYSAELEGNIQYLEIGLDPLVLAYTVVLAVIAGLLFGLVPAVHATRTDFAAALKTTGSERGYRRSGLRAGLLVAQVALSLVLLISGVLLAQSLRSVLVQSGFDAEHVAFIRMKTNVAAYAPAQSEAYFRAIAARLKSIPGVEAVSFAAYPPLHTWCCDDTFAVPGRGDESENTVRARFNWVTPTFFEALGIPIAAGRAFDERDIAPGIRPVIVNEAFAAHFWPGQSAVGMTTTFKGQAFEVVGVARYSNYKKADGTGRLFAFFPRNQAGNRMFIRVTGDPRTMLPVLRREIATIDPEVPISEAMALADMIETYFMPVQLATAILGYAAGLALLLSAIGLYGVIAYAVGQRTREIGIRIALGAPNRDIIRLVTREGIAVALIGTALGILGALASTRLLGSLLYGVGTTDASTFTVGPALLLLVAAAASWVPVRKAVGVNPLQAVRCE